MTERRSIRLEGVRADGWFERIGDRSQNFRQLCTVVGEKFVAFSVVSGVRITALTVDPRFPDSTLVDFVLGEEKDEHRLPLGEFRRRLATALLSAEPPGVSAAAATDEDNVLTLVGLRYLLLAPVFGITLEELQVGGDNPPTMVLTVDGKTSTLTLSDFRQVIHDGVRAELERLRPDAPFNFDADTITAAEKACASSEWDTVIELLGAWPGPLALLLRTQDGQMMAPEIRTHFARALGFLGLAYARTGRPDWAEEVMRLGIQWGQDGTAAAMLFRQLGEMYVDRDRQGEAIAYLRRSLALGAAAREVLPFLATCYAARGRYVAAAVCATEALAAGASEGSVAVALSEARERLGSAFDRFRELVPVEDTSAKTLRPSDPDA